MKTEAGVIVLTTFQQYSTCVVCVVFVEKFPAMLAPPVYIQNRQRRQRQAKLGNESGVPFSEKGHTLKQLITLV